MTICDIVIVMVNLVRGGNYMSELSGLPGLYSGSDDYDLVLFIDNLEGKNLDIIDNYIKNLALKNKTANNWDVCLMKISQNEESYQNTDSFELVYKASEERYSLYDVDFHITHNKSAYNLEDALKITEEYFANSPVLIGRIDY